MIASRAVSLASAAARPAFRRAALQSTTARSSSAAPATAPASAFTRSFTSTRPAAAASSHDSHGSAKEDTSSDLPYVLSSAVVFGALFFYLTSPASKAHNEHGQIVGAHKPTKHGHGSAVVDDKTGDDAIWLKDDADAEGQEEEEADGTDHASHLEGHQSLLNMPTKPFDHQKSPTNRDPSNESRGPENSNFQHGLAAARDGDHVSDPKKVVAAAQAHKQAQKAAKEKSQQDFKEAADSANSEEGGKDDGEEAEEKQEGKEDKE